MGAFNKQLQSQTGPVAMGGVSGVVKTKGYGTTTGPDGSIQPIGVPAGGGFGFFSGSGGGGGGAGGGGGGGGSTYSVGDMNINVQEDPKQRALANEAQQYQQGLAAGSDQDATNALARQRDLISGMAQEAGQGATFRTGGGGVADSARQAQFQQGQRNLTGLQSDLASDARQKQLQALQMRSGMEQGIAQTTLGQQNFALNQWQAQQQAQQAAAQLAAMQQQNGFDNQMRLLNTMFTGF